jgi:hypothetical protein
MSASIKQRHRLAVARDAAARIHSSIAGRIKVRNTPPPLASNDLFGSPSIKSRNAVHLKMREFASRDVIHHTPRTATVAHVN